MALRTSMLLPLVLTLLAECSSSLSQCEAVEDVAALQLQRGLHTSDGLPDPSTRRLPVTIPGAQHLYRKEPAEAPGSCEDYALDAELESQGWDPARYPWSFIRGRPRRRVEQRKVLFGTRFAQDAIWEHQHPRDCSKAKFLIPSTVTSGIGSELHVLGVALAMAMEQGRVLAFTDNVATHYADEDSCPGVRTWDCWLQNLTSCVPQGDIQKVSMYSFQRDLVPEVFRQRLERCSPIEKGSWFYWWRAQAAAYMLRFNPTARSAIDRMRLDTLVMCGKKTPKPLELLPPDSVNAHVRHGNKGREAPLHNFSEYVEVLNSSTAGRDPAVFFASRRLFLSTEDPQVVTEALELCGAEPPWEITYTQVPRRNTDSWMHMGGKESNTSAREEVLKAFVNLELALEADAWICTLSSNWCRLIDELRMTIGMKAFNPLMSLDSCRRDPPAFYCDLNW